MQRTDLRDHARVGHDNARRSVGPPLTYRDAARSHVHGLDEFGTWIAQAERGAANRASITAQQTDNIRYAIETLDALRRRLDRLAQSLKTEVRR